MAKIVNFEKRLQAINKISRLVTLQRAESIYNIASKIGKNPTPTRSLIEDLKDIARQNGLKVCYSRTKHKKGYYFSKNCELNVFLGVDIKFPEQE